MSKVIELSLPLPFSLYLSISYSQGGCGKASTVALLKHLSIFVSSKFKEQKTMRIIKLNRLRRCKCKFGCTPFPFPSRPLYSEQFLITLEHSALSPSSSLSLTSMCRTCLSLAGCTHAHASRDGIKLHFVLVAMSNLTLCREAALAHFI